MFTLHSVLYSSVTLFFWSLFRFKKKFKLPDTHPCIAFLSSTQFRLKCSGIIHLKKPKVNPYFRFLIIFFGFFRIRFLIFIFPIDFSSIHVYNSFVVKNKGYYMFNIATAIKPHRNFRSVFIGTGGLEFLINPVGLSEIWNDHAGEIFNLYEVLQNRSTFLDFKQLCNHTLFSEDQFLTSRNRSQLPVAYFGPPSVPRAWDYFIALNFSLDANLEVFKSAMWRAETVINANVLDWHRSIGNLDLIHRRLQFVELRRMSFQNFIFNFKCENCSFFADIPQSINVLEVLECLRETKHPFLLLSHDLDITSEFYQTQIETCKSSLFYQNTENTTKLMISNY